VNLQQLVLHQNNLTGCLPCELGSLLSIQRFDVSKNNLKSDCISTVNITLWKTGKYSKLVRGETTGYACDPVGNSTSDQVHKVNSSPSSIRTSMVLSALLGLVIFLI